MDLSEKLARIKINGFGYLRPDWCRRLIEIYGSAREILGHSAAEIAKDGGVSQDTAANFLREAGAINPELEIEKTQCAGGEILINEDEGYPENLTKISEPPLVLYVRGKADFSLPAVAVVGTRRTSAYGRRMAASLSHDLCLRNIVVVSGLARGIDTIAHQAAVGAQKPTWAVLGSGLGVCYPSENAGLMEEIIKRGGAIISEFPFVTSPKPFYFPRRNRIISALSCAVVVVEGAETSGALITAKLALEQGKEVLAVPGPADSEQSAGPNRLIKDGATPACSAQDIIEVIPQKYLSMITIETASDDEKAKPKVSAVLEDSDEAQIINCMGSEELAIDEIIERLNWSIQRAASALFELEAKSLVVCSDGKYSKKI